MEASTCEIHPGKKLKFVCKECEKTLVCSDCFHAKHFGHQGIDVAEAASDARGRIPKVKEGLEGHLQTVRSKLHEAKRDLYNFEASVTTSHDTLNEYCTRLSDIVKKMKDEIGAKIDEEAMKGRRFHNKVITSLEKEEEETTQQIRRAKEALDSESVHKVIRIDKGLPKVSDLETVSEISEENVPSQLVLTGHEDLQRMSEEMRKLTGEPHLVYNDKACPFPLAAHQIRCPDSRPRRVEALCPATDGDVYVVYTETHDGQQKQYISLYDIESGLEVVRKEVELKRKQIKIQHVSSFLLFHNVSSDGRPVRVDLDFDTPVSDPQVSSTRSPIYTLKKTQSRKYVVCDERKSGKEAEVFQIKAEDPVAICADKDETIFAVIQCHEKAKPQSSNSPTKTPSVAIFQKENPNRVAVFQPNVEGFLPSDICFYVSEGEERLLVSDETSKCIYVVKFKTSEKKLNNYDTLHASAFPWMASPTAMAVDKYGRLWVGSGGGQISVCKAPEHLYLEPVTTENEPERDECSIGQDSDECADDSDFDDWDSSSNGPQGEAHSLHSKSLSLTEELKQRVQLREQRKASTAPFERAVSSPCLPSGHAYERQELGRSDTARSEHQFSQPSKGEGLKSEEEFMSTRRGYHDEWEGGIHRRQNVQSLQHDSSSTADHEGVMENLPQPHGEETWQFAPEIAERRAARKSLQLSPRLPTPGTRRPSSVASCRALGSQAAETVFIPKIPDFQEPADQLQTESIHSHYQNIDQFFLLEAETTTNWTQSTQGRRLDPDDPSWLGARMNSQYGGSQPLLGLQEQAPALETAVDHSHQAQTRRHKPAKPPTVLPKPRPKPKSSPPPEDGSELMKKLAERRQKLEKK